MNEVEKLYENAGISNIWVEESCEPERHYNSYEEMINNMMKTNGWTLMEAQAVAESKCRKEYPPFTAEKQIQLILFILNTFKQGFNCRVEGGKISLDTLARGIAQEVINCWQDLTDAEKAQIKSILESEVRE